MALPGQPQSYWIATTPGSDYPPLQDNMAVDVAILGGGIVGITAATILKKAGLRVALVEARRILTGVTGHTTAKVTSQHGIKYSHLLSRVGRERAAMYGAANQAAVETIAATCAHRGIDAEFRRWPACTFAETAEHREQIVREANAAQELGLPVQFLEQVPLPFPTMGALCFRDQALFHPRKYLMALASAIPGDGSHLFEQTTALDVEESTPLTVVTSRGRLRAEHVIVATHTPFLNRGLYFTRQEASRSYVLAVRLRGEPPQGLFISPKPGYHSVRPHQAADGTWVVLMGGAEHRTGMGGDTVKRYMSVEEWARGHFDVESIDYHWSTQDNVTVDGLPFVGHYTPVSPRLYVATGFAGWGMTNGTAAAVIVSDMVLGRRNDWAPAYDPSRLDQLTSVGKLAKGGVIFTQRFLGPRLLREPSETHITLKRGEGRIVEAGGERVALYADDDGKLHAVTPYCAHQGCLLAWNTAERTWDCPCHGSRYLATGEFIDGPTVRDLKPVRLDAAAEVAGGAE